MIVLATPEGEKLFNDADRASVDAGQADLLLAVESEILDLLVDKAAFIDPTVTALLKQLVLSCNDAEHPQRVLYFTNGSLRNLMLVAVGLPMVVSAAVTVGASGIAIAVAALIYDSESELVKLAKTEFGGKVDDFAVKVLLPHEDLVRRWVAQKPASRQVVLDMFERVKANRKS